MSWSHYPDLEPIRRLKNEGRELLGKPIYLTEKRDGENVSIWMDDKEEVHISSHHMEEADSSIQQRLKSTPEWVMIPMILLDEKSYNRDVVLYGELLKTVSPTRLEPKRKHVHWVLFDIYDRTNGCWDDYIKVYQTAYDWGIPVVKAVDKFIPETLDEVFDKVKASLKWCGKHRREGIVGKVYGDKPIFFKEKRNIPELPKTKRVSEVKPQYPPMPEETIIRGLQHAYDECVSSGFEWVDKSHAIPLVVKHLTTEAREHNYAIPKNFYTLYIEAPLEKIKTK